MGILKLLLSAPLLPITLPFPSPFPPRHPSLPPPSLSSHFFMEGPLQEKEGRGGGSMGLWVESIALDRLASSLFPGEVAMEGSMMLSAGEVSGAEWTLYGCCCPRVLHSYGLPTKIRCFLVRRDALLILDFGFDILDGITGLSLKGELVSPIRYSHRPASLCPC